MFTMGDIARCSLGGSHDFHNEDLLYRMFGINAELLVDHAWGWEPCRMADVRAYKPESSSIGSGQVLHSPYPFDKARLVVREMADALALDLVDRNLVTDQIVLTVGYDMENLTDPKLRRKYQGAVTTDRYGRKVPKHAHGTINLDSPTSSARLVTEAVVKLYDRIVSRDLLVRRLYVTACRLAEENSLVREEKMEQMNLFTDYEALEKARREEAQELERERKLQNAMLEIKKKFGKNAILKGMNLEEGATARERNQQIGGHKA